uniref:Mediator complex subunit 29 n=1 Tax=Strongyloides venezuelensis TaxID=75913 RepID=A0A0K0FJU1_STRVS
MPVHVLALVLDLVHGFRQKNEDWIDERKNINNLLGNLKQRGSQLEEDLSNMQEFAGKCAESNKIVTEDYLIPFDKALSNAEEALSKLEKAINEKKK